MLHGCVELCARYLQFDRPAAMVFHFRQPGGAAPSSADCRAVADAFGLWENLGYGLGYALLRSVDSLFTGASCRSLDITSRANFVDSPFERPGLILGEIAKLMPTSCAPLVRWADVEGREAAGRTYAVGLTTEASARENDTERVNALYRAALASIFGALGPGIEAATGYRQVLVSRRRHGASGSLPRAVEVAGCGVYERMGTQRRRTRPG